MRRGSDTCRRSSALSSATQRLGGVSGPLPPPHRTAAIGRAGGHDRQNVAGDEVERARREERARDLAPCRAAGEGVGSAELERGRGPRLHEAARTSELAAKGMPRGSTTVPRRHPGLQARFAPPRWAESSCWLRRCRLRGGLILGHWIEEHRLLDLTGRTNAGGLRAAEFGGHALGEAAEPGHDVGMLGRHVGRLADVRVEIVEPRLIQ